MEEDADKKEEPLSMREPEPGHCRQHYPRSNRVCLKLTSQTFALSSQHGLADPGDTAHLCPYGNNSRDIISLILWRALPKA